jgi:hypothetical protein
LIEDGPSLRVGRPAASQSFRSPRYHASADDCLQPHFLGQAASGDLPRARRTQLSPRNTDIVNSRRSFDWRLRLRSGGSCCAACLRRRVTRLDLEQIVRLRRGSLVGFSSSNPRTFVLERSARMTIQLARGLVADTLRGVEQLPRGLSLYWCMVFSGALPTALADCPAGFVSRQSSRRLPAHPPVFVRVRV